MAIKPTRSDAESTTDQAFETVTVDISGAGARTTPKLTKKDCGNPRESFLFFISSSEYQLIRGVYLPRPKKVFVTKGSNYVGARGELGNALLYQEGLGRMLVPTRTIVTAWGEKVEGYVRPHQTTMGRLHHTSVWEKYRKVGPKAVWEKDQDGYFEFCQVCHALLNPDGADVDPMIAELAVRGIMAELDYLGTRPPYDTVAQRRKEHLLSLLPKTDQSDTTKGGRKKA